MEAVDISPSFQLQELPNSKAGSIRSTPMSSQPIDVAREPLAPGSDAPVNAKITTRAWLSIAGSFLFLFTSYGFMQTIGTIQAYLEIHQLSAYSSRDVGWITGAFTALTLLLGIQVGPLFDAYGPQYLGPVGCLVYIPVFFVLAECHTYWQFMLVMGIWGGIGAAIVSMVGIGVISKWFTRRRGMAMGLALCGSSVGGVVMPLMLRKLLPTVGWAWSIRSIAFLLSAIMIIGALCLQHPLPSPPSGIPLAVRRKRAVLNFKALKSWTFAFVTVGLSALEFSIFGIFSLLPTYAMVAGFNSDTGYTLIAVANATSTAGRFLSGLASDHFGPFNTMVFMVLVTTIFTASIFVPFGSSSLGALTAFSALWGFGSGSFISLAPVCMGLICETEDYGRYFGLFPPFPCIISFSAN
ncbi:major facilitator superfamily transporter monocarboxylate [Grosmannia clavigera kw1407]|uniref:Major facilitator superfamily transporter monocarboxylate n=1 Tax=Grosmannia clavigera (strain kw1407 / UAMH 11150) TaxID=655863 RepID=F0XBI2_GROCL|nr:major facilitator superfamily transporter monocarboxylate [Grosmannia clavigera kw1407]EFX05084.1 major facilitator superfamily transporter monocarboxylate [Grosmannia clavigera kw1407]